MNAKDRELLCYGVHRVMWASAFHMNVVNAHKKNSISHFGPRIRIIRDCIYDKTFLTFCQVVLISCSCIWRLTLADVTFHLIALKAKCVTPFETETDYTSLKILTSAGFTIFAFFKKKNHLICLQIISYITL